MGEIGITRREFLYDIQYWEVPRLIEGYRRRDIPKLQLLRIVAYYAKYVMRENKNGETPMDFLPMPFDDDEDTGSGNGKELSDDEYDELAQLIAANNKSDG